MCQQGSWPAAPQRLQLIPACYNAPIKKAPSRGFFCNSNHHPRIQLGISACLLGQRVRYDGNHNRNGFITGTLNHYADFIPLCPEAGIGLGTPRPPIQLVNKGGQIRVLGVTDPRVDATERLQNFARSQLPSLDTVSGYIFKQHSPSCGLHKVKLFDQSGQMQNKGTGVFASVIQQLKPLLPVAEESCFANPLQQDDFLTRVYVYRRWQDLLSSGQSIDKLFEFHAACEALVQTHSKITATRLKQLLTNLSASTLQEKSSAYIQTLMQILKQPVEQQQHYDVQLHPYPRALWQSPD